MWDGLAPAPREQGWKRIVLALAAFLLVPRVPALRAVTPIEHTLLLLVPALAVCFLVGWLMGGRFGLAVAWLTFAGLVVAIVAAPVRAVESTAYFDVARAWGLLAAGAFGVVSLFASDRPFLHRALSAVGLALLLALLLVLLGQLPADRGHQLFADQFSARNVASAVMLDSAPRLPFPETWSDDWLRLLRVSSNLAARVYPALLALESVAACAIAWGLYHRLSRTRIGPPLARLRDFRFSDQMIWGLFAGVALLLLPSLERLSTLGWNLVTFFAALYALRGLGVAAWFVVPRGAVVTTLAIVAAFLAGPLTLLAAVGIGLCDTWFDWRRMGDRLGRQPSS
ncbi:MAG TPA: DUF2232 domain-containing protein [Gemmatimonadaceae bacterium]|nr:DUF2232 domain-containing protein [Gemmatimonadaceae bacterium]